MARKAWLGGNWKCNGTKESVAALCTKLAEAPIDKERADVVVFPSPLHVDLAHRTLQASGAVCVGAQNVSGTSFGAFTGAVAAEMVRDFGLEWTLVGHSERRQLYGETDGVVGKKITAALAAGLKVALCIGETLEQREQGVTERVLREQLEACVAAIGENWAKIVVAYEPVWAIGTGKVATTQQAQDAHKVIRAFVESKVSRPVAEALRIVYGGSVNDKNCAELAKMPDIDGFLVGGASLDAGKFTVIYKALEVVKKGQ